jgi:signal transduction histidine kinase
VPIVDLPVVGALYYFDAEPTGPLFVLFFVAVVSAAVTMPLRAVVAYTAAVLLVTVFVAPTLPLWDPNPWEIRALGSRLVVLTMVAIGTAVLTRRLGLEQATARSMRGEAERLEELDRLRARFLSTISHDLRTPLTAARAGLGMLETSAADRLEAGERELLGNARRNIERLGRFIDDLLTVNQLDAGALELDREPLDLRAVATDAMSAVHPLIREKRQTLEVDLPDALPTAGDARRLEQVVVNLLANAHQHTPAGTRITISGRSDGEVVLSVSDDGPGIPVGEQDTIFRRFYRLPTSGGGSGLGLEIARSIVELHGGRLWVESAPGRGATFHVALPRHEREGQP